MSTSLAARNERTNGDWGLVANFYSKNEKYSRPDPLSWQMKFLAQVNLNTTLSWTLSRAGPDHLGKPRSLRWFGGVV